MTRAKDISKIITDADFSGTLDVAGELQVGVDGTTAGLIRLMDSGSVTEEATISTDANGGLIFGGNSGPGELIFKTSSGTERMRITSGGNIGIGNSNPSQLLEVSGKGVFSTANPDVNGLKITATTGTNASAMTFSNTATAYVGLDNSAGGRISGVPYGLAVWNQSAYPVVFGTNGSERMRITSGGSVGIGTDSPSQKLDVNGTIVASTTASQGARIERNGTTGGANFDSVLASGSLHFRTGATERVQITSAGAMTVGTTTSLTTVGGITLRNDVQSDFPTLLFLQNQPGTGGTMGADIHMGYASDYGSILRFTGNPFSARPGGFQFRRVTGSGTSDLSMEIANNGDVYVPGVYANTTGNGANVFVGSDGQLERSTSSQRYKNTINDATHGLTELLTLRPVTYKGNNDGDTVYGGLIAEEVHDAGLTEFVQYNDDGEPDALAYGNMVSLCIKAIQELKAELDSAKARITALENGV